MILNDDHVIEAIRTRGLVEMQGLERAKSICSATGERLVSVLTRLGLCGEEDLADLLAGLSDLPRLAEGALVADHPVSAEFLERHGIVPLKAGNGLAFAVSDPGDDFAIEALSRSVGRPVAITVGTVSEITGLIRGDEPRNTPQSTRRDASLADDAARLKESQGQEPAIRFVDDMVAEAVSVRASDIHMEPGPGALAIRRRIDGILSAWREAPKTLAPEITARIKVLAGLDVAERRMPQDGRFRMAVRGKPVDIRVSILPTLFGESVVLRVLDKSAQVAHLSELGLSAHLEEGLRDLARHRHGLILVTGPTGSGKTTTLYSLLRELQTTAAKIVTVEDPVEFDLPGTGQIQINTTIGLDFARVLRSTLRHDPDVIMVGEIRDGETARIAVQAALTGHLVLATVHTNGAAESITRLTDMGIEPYLVSSVLRGAFSQRLVRRLCDCAGTAPIPQSALGDFANLDAGAETWREARGCPKCQDTGYRGRVPVGELLTITPTLAEAINQTADGHAIAKLAKASGLRGLREDGLMRILTGETSMAALSGVL